MMCACAAVREDRTPGGKHRAKKLRGDESEISTTGIGGGPVVIDWNGYEQDELLLSRLVDTKPDAVNTVEGVLGKHFLSIFRSTHQQNRPNNANYLHDVLFTRKPHYVMTLKLLSFLRWILWKLLIGSELVIVCVCDRYPRYYVEHRSSCYQRLHAAYLLGITLYYRVGEESAGLVSHVLSLNCFHPDCLLYNDSWHMCMDQPNSRFHGRDIFRETGSLPWNWPISVKSVILMLLLSFTKVSIVLSTAFSWILLFAKWLLIKCYTSALNSWNVLLTYTSHHTH